MNMYETNFIQFFNGAGPISLNGDIYSNDGSLHKKSWFQISIKSFKPSPLAFLANLWETKFYFSLA